MSNENIVLVDPLSAVTRGERRMLLGLSMLGIFFVKAGVLPSKINALGIELTASDQKTFLFLVSVGILYFICAFFLYAISDFIVWKKAIIKQYLAEYSESFDETCGHSLSVEEMDMQSEKSRIYRRNKIWLKLSKPVSIFRALFEFILPILVALCSMFLMINKAIYSD